MKRALPYLAILAAIAFALFEKRAYDKAQQRIGADSVLLAQSRQEVDSLTLRLQSYHDSIRTDTAVVTRIVQRYRILRDTLRYADTVTVERLVAMADSVVTACPAALARCARALQLAERRDTVRIDQIRLVQHKPSIRAQATRTMFDIAVWEGAKALLRRSR